MSKELVKRPSKALGNVDEVLGQLVVARERGDWHSIKAIRDRAKTVQTYIEAHGEQGFGKEWLGMGLDAAQVRIEAERTFGKLDAEQNPHGGSRKQDKPGLSWNVSAPTRSKWRKLGQIDDATFAAIIKELRSAQYPEITTAAVLRAADKGKRKETRREAVVRADGTAEIGHGDAIEFLQQQRSIDLLLTDPPFSSDIDDIEGFVASWVPLALDRMSAEGRAYVFCGAYADELIAYLDTFRRHNWANGLQLLGWSYMNTLGPQPSMGYLRNWQAIVYAHGPDAPRINSDRLVELVSIFQAANPARGQDRVHRWQKPDELGEMFIKHGSQEGQTVIDPFAGSGTFLAAAARVGRHGRGVDVDSEAVQLAVDRGIRRV